MKVYDCSMFFNEVELLIIRLHTLNDAVDCFVVVESNMTHVGKRKPMYLNLEDPRIAPFRHKIRHIIVTLPELDPKALENVQGEFEGYSTFQRNGMIQGLDDAEADDIMLISDADEIIRPNVIPRRIESGIMYRFLQSAHYYYLNTKKMFDWNNGSYALRFGDIKEGENFFGWISNKQTYEIPNGGWHFSYLGGEEGIRLKIASYAAIHENNPGRIGQWLDAMHGATTVERFDDTWPTYLQANPEEFRHLTKGLK